MGYNGADGAERHLAGLNLVVVHSAWIPGNAGLTETGKLVVEFSILYKKDMKIGMQFAFMVNTTIMSINWTIPFR